MRYPLAKTHILKISHTTDAPLRSVVLSLGAKHALPHVEIYLNIIYEYNDKAIRERPKYLVHQIHKGRWCISESKRHH